MPTRIKRLRRRNPETGETESIDHQKCRTAGLSDRSFGLIAGFFAGGAVMMAIMESQRR